MSHNITMTGVKITDMGMLGDVVSEMSKGLASLDMGAKTFRTYHGQPDKCDARINMPGPHDVGFLKDADGAYVPVFDPYRMSDVLKSSFGSNHIGGLLQEYTLRQAEYEAAQNGMASQRVAGERGVVTLELVPA